MNEKRLLLKLNKELQESNKLILDKEQYDYLKELIKKRFMELKENDL